MAKLTTKERKRLPASDFGALNDKSNARNALARVPEDASPDAKSRLKARINKKIPGIKIEGGKSAPRLDRASRGA